MYARLEPTGEMERNWQALDDKGTVLMRLSGTSSAVRSPALASLIADHGFPPGSWVADGDGFLIAAA
ncbi:hypothetical protein [Mycolicibacterium fortuitum]|uniref:hypothetical protein n=1 Tax=Mycolicibacterium fortuitum TaxID=1766 RepID=UPI001CDD898E|nr:hypothetical protein [Mycolicibacterium fortuitum]UBV13019.1 hypothetical protein H8Z57_19285 [Mycolicibacterium fortuitum]